MAAFYALNTKARSLLATTLSLCALPAIAADLHKEAKFEIAAQALLPALYEFSTQAKVQIVTKAAEISGAVTHGVKGKKSLNGALDELLQGTPFSFEIMDDSTIAIISRPTADTAASGSGLSDSWDRFLLVQADSSSTSTYAANEETKIGQSDQGAKREIEALEEVVVTAQRREESLQKVPISISVLAGAELDKDNSQTLNDTLASVPGVFATEQGQSGQTVFALRGVVSNTSLFNGAATVGYYIDDVPFAFNRFPISPDMSAYDLQRVEVLRGPQGSLYGVSSLNGVVRVISNDANLERLEVKGRFSGSTTRNGGESYRGDAAVNVPLVPGKLAVRVVAGYADYAGWIDDMVGGRDINDAAIKNLRVKINARPTDDFGIEVTSSFSEDRRGSIQASDANYVAPNGSRGPVTTTLDTHNLALTYDLPGFSILSSTSLARWRNDGILDFGGGTLFRTDLTARLFSEEIRLSSNGESDWRWSVGGIYRNETDHRISTFNFAPLLPAIVDYGSRSGAVFGELTRALGQFEIMGGLRYFEDRQNYTELGCLNAALGTANCLYLVTGKDKFHKLTPRLVLTYNPSDTTSLYASYSQGFRSGFKPEGDIVRLRSPNVVPPVRPDLLTNYEVGMKGTLLDRRITYDIAAYYIHWKDPVLIPRIANVVGGGVTFFSALPTNGPALNGPGIDVNATAKVTDRFNVGVTASYNDLKFQDDVISNNIVYFPKGGRTERSPSTTASFFADYTAPLSDDRSLRFAGSGNYHSKMITVSSLTGVIAEGANIFTAEANMTLEAKHWSARLFVENLTDNQRGVDNANPLVAGYRLRPRTIGLQFDFKY